MTDTQAITHLRCVVAHQDDCVFDHHGDCQTHFTDGSAPGRCGVAEARAFLAAHDALAALTEDDEQPKFEAGKYYITENGGFVFQCNQVVADGTALGRELRVDGLPADVSQQTYQRPGTRSLWVEIDEETVHAKYGIHGWVHRPKQRPAAN